MSVFFPCSDSAQLLSHLGNLSCSSQNGKKHMKRDSIRERKHAAVQVKTASKRVFFVGFALRGFICFF